MLKIAKKYILATDEKINDLPVLEFTGQGAIDFDTQAGVVAAVDMKYAIKFNSENMVVTIPVKLSAKLLSTEEAQAVAQEQADKAQAARAAAAEAARPKPIDDAGVSAALSELSQSDAFKVRSALDRLARAIPLENRRREVAAAVEPLAADRDQFTAMAALKVLAAWGGRENVPALIAAMNSQEFFVRTGAMAALGNIKDPRGAEAVAKQAIPFHGRMQASQALQAMGDVAEPYVLPLLKNSDWGVRMEACKILGVIGTDASVAPLRQASSDENGLVKREADNALRSIEGRLKQPQKARPVVHPTA